MIYLHPFLYNDTATTEIYTYRHTLSLHDALPISLRSRSLRMTLSPSGDQSLTQSASVVVDIVSTLPSSRSEEHTSELQSLMRISYAVFCLKKKSREMHVSDHRPAHSIIYKAASYSPKVNKSMTI